MNTNLVIIQIPKSLIWKSFNTLILYIYIYIYIYMTLCNFRRITLENSYVIKNLRKNKSCLPPLHVIFYFSNIHHFFLLISKSSPLISSFMPMATPFPVYTTPTDYLVIVGTGGPRKDTTSYDYHYKSIPSLRRGIAWG